MKIQIEVNESGKCNPQKVILGKEGNKNIDSIVLKIDNKLPTMNWYILFENNLYATVNKEIQIDQRFTEKKGRHAMYILGSDAKENTNIKSGNYYFQSDMIVAEII